MTDERQTNRLKRNPPSPNQKPNETRGYQLADRSFRTTARDSAQSLSDVLGITDLHKRTFWWLTIVVVFGTTLGVF